MSREEHLAWCKTRAYEYLDAGDLTNAITSMLSDLDKHPELKDHAGINLGVLMVQAGLLAHEDQIRYWIRGFR